MTILLALILTVLFVFCIYAAAPTWYNKHANPRIIRRAPGKGEIMLTFDDGPDERYTGKLLDLLQEYGVKATFFLVGKNARRSPQLVDRMLAEGHRIGVHSSGHKNAWLKTPWEEWRDFEKSAQLFCGRWHTSLYRPPWGHTNLFSTWFARRHGYRVMLWSVMAEDWSRRSSAGTIAAKLQSRTGEHDVICLHDAGENSGGAKGAPLCTIAALRTAIPFLLEKGYRFVLPEVD